ncbi:AAA family ATPase [Dyella psychrodurans]|uniref:AAA family ATPase n=1 Tax=Dyella psychrodurans TaxID=1927960 RepID=A0A370X792_9GAMM|nr:AAA family ATPase [Dyella psychrodurans]RDS84137.1 AAA family ATPase [Dyella psychrodurans]
MNTRDVLKKLRKANFMHPKFEEAFDRVYAHAALGLTDSVIMVVGPTRVGKTTLSRLLESKLACSDLVEGSDIPLIRIEAATTDRGFISSKYLTLRMLQALKHPFYDDDGYQARLSDSETKLRSRLDKALRARGTRFILIDEAHHLLRTKSNRAIGSVLDSLKCLANETGVILILFGGYELLKTCFQSAHLNGRATFIDFSNYKATGADIHVYDGILASIDRLLPWANGHCLLNYRNFIYSGTLGCYGLLIRWISAALAEMEAAKSKTLKMLHFSRTQLKEQIAPIKDDIELGVSLMNELASTDGDELSIPGRSRNRGAHRASLKPGTRKPGRDPVGV